MANPCPKRSEARTKPNQRLVEVFGIKNIFTDEKQRDFKLETIRKMRAACKMSTTDDKGDWTDLRERAVEYCHVCMQRASGDGSINLTELVRFITLKLSLSCLFADAETASKTNNTFDDIKLIGRRINDLWIDSKKPDGE